MNKEELKNMLKEKEDLLERVRNTMQQLVGQILLIQDLLKTEESKVEKKE